MESPSDESKHRSVPLSGEWELSLDGDHPLTGAVGEAARQWVKRVRLPGSLAVQGIGDPISISTDWTGTIFNRSFFDSPACARLREPGNLRLPFWLQPRTAFKGAAWFRREIEIPEAWRGRRITLFLERPHWFTRLWLDDREVGSGESLSTSHEFELGLALAPGRYRLTLCVDNRVHVAIGENAHSISDHTQGNWNGVVGQVELRSTAPVWIEHVEVHPHVERSMVSVAGQLGGATGPVGVTISLPDREGEPVQLMTTAEGHFSAELSLGRDAAVWDEFSPVRHALVISLANGESQAVSFGLRGIESKGGRLLLNGRPLFLRGALDCCVFPATGHPPMDVESWRRILRTIKDHGLNHVRFHSWCPPEAAFEAGDELGVYFQVEAGTWPNSAAVLAGQAPSGIGDGASVDQWTWAETERILRAYGNHPCFLLMAAGNEPGGPDHRAYLHRWVTHFRGRDSRRLFTGAAGWPELAVNQFHLIPEPRAHQWGEGLSSRMNALPPATTADYRTTVARRAAPVIAHEIGQWCSYPPINDAAKYQGHLEPRSFGVFAETLAAHGLAHRVADFVHASGRLQALCYKEEIEAALRTPGLAGFQLLGLQDFPGQGTAPVGVLDAFWESKGSIAAAAYRRFAGPVVPLARLPRRVFTTDEMFEAELELANFGTGELAPLDVTWQLLTDTGSVVSAGQRRLERVPMGNGHSLGRIEFSLKEVPAPQHARLVVGLAGTSHENDWEVWIYPARVPADPGEVIVTSSTLTALDELSRGGRVLLQIPPGRLQDDVALGFTPIFWNTWCTKGQAPHTLGILCDPSHPALANFPTDGHSNWQWWHLLSRGGAMILDGIPALEPIVRVIDDWYTNRSLGLVIEAAVGEGRLIVCSIDLTAVNDPVVRQFRHSLLRWLADATAPKPPLMLTPGQVRSLARET